MWPEEMRACNIEIDLHVSHPVCIVWIIYNTPLVCAHRSRQAKAMVDGEGIHEQPAQCDRPSNNRPLSFDNPYSPQALANAAKLRS